MGRVALATCWYTRRHVPASVPRTRAEGAFRSVCRFCESPIHSHDKKSWTLSTGLDLDELAGNSEYIAVVDRGDGLVIARVPIERDLSKADLQKKIDEVRLHYAIEPGDPSYSVTVHRRSERGIRAA